MSPVDTSQTAQSLPWAQFRLPPFSPVALRVLQLASHENVQLHELSELISSDPALATEVLTIVNSLLYAPRFPVSSILQAIAVMGATHLQGLCLMVGARGYMGKSLDHPAMRRLWRHNIASATIAEQVALAGFIDRDSAFTSGVMHDIGRLALASIRPKDYIRLLEAFAGTSEDLLEEEQRLFGLDHCQIGNRLVSEWRLPEDFRAVVAHHHAPQSDNSPWDMAALICFSCHLADAAGFAAFPGCQPMPFDALVKRLPERERNHFPTEIEPLVAEVKKKINALEAI